MADTPLKQEFSKLGRLWWLVDGTLFIDPSLVDRLHDAIVRPEYEDQRVETTAQKKVKDAFEGAGKISGTIEVPKAGLLSLVLPTFEVGAELGIQGANEREEQDTRSVSGRLVYRPARQLKELVAFYLRHYPERVLFVDVPGGEYSNFEGKPLTRSDVEKLLVSPPRPLVFADLRPRSPILPTMAEMEKSGFRAIYKKLETELAAYPSERDPDAVAKRKEYWDVLNDTFNSRTAMEAIETSCDTDRIGWIDFRVLLATGGETAHLHVVPSGQYHAGVFAYNFVHRGYRHGCRIVGSLKSGNDINVLAIYEC